MKLSLSLLISAALQGCYAVPIQQHDQAILNGNSGAETVVKALKTARVIPHVLPETFNPSHALQISYPSSHQTVDLGNTIPVKDTSNRPVFQIKAFASASIAPSRTLSENGTYVLVLTDPDATSRAQPVKAQMCHWIATGVRLTKVNCTEGFEAGESANYALDLTPLNDKLEVRAVEELIEYMGPAPPKRTGKHRYVFVLLEGKDGKGGTKDELQPPKDRVHWGYPQNDGERPGVVEWAQDNNLIPVAANFFYAEHAV